MIATSLERQLNADRRTLALLFFFFARHSSETSVSLLVLLNSPHTWLLRPLYLSSFLQLPFPRNSSLSTHSDSYAVSSHAPSVSSLPTTVHAPTVVPPSLQPSLAPLSFKLPLFTFQRAEEQPPPRRHLSTNQHVCSLLFFCCPIATFSALHGPSPVGDFLIPLS